MSKPQQEDELAPSTTPGYKVGAAKTLDEYADLDKEDESLARWKASLGIVPGAAAGPATGPKVTILSMELVSPTMPPGKTLIMDLTQPDKIKETTFKIKEGAEYNVRVHFKVNHSIVSGARYIQAVKLKGVRVDKSEEMLGSYGPSPNPYTKNFDTDKAPSGTLGIRPTFDVESQIIDDDKVVYLRWQWRFKLSSSWE